jgi:hypothetical protein
MRKRNANQLKRFTEAQKVVWIETRKYLQESLKSGVEPQQEYNWQYVQPFAYYIS